MRLRSIMAGVPTEPSCYGSLWNSDGMTCTAP
jgi:hypothetical protein